MNNCLNCGEEILDLGCKVVDASCVNIDTPNLNCITNISKGDNLKNVLEAWDKFFCETNNISLITCVRTKLGFPADQTSTTQATLLAALQNYICNLQDEKVKAAQGDTTPGYLYDKIEGGECILLSVTEVSGVKKLKISLDFPCLLTKIPTCFSIETNECFIVEPNDTCVPSPLVPVITRNGTNLSGSNCNGSIQWYNKNNQLVGSGSNISVPSNNTYYAKCATNCGESIASNSIVVPIITTYTKVRTATFVKNDCGLNDCGIPCSGTSAAYSKTYTSTISQENVNSIAQNDASFAVDGQTYANTIGTCSCSDCNCVFPTYNNNIVKTNSTCSGSVINANGQILIAGISNADKFGYYVGSGDYAGATYSSAFTLNNFNSGNVETTPSTVRIKSFSIETRVVVRLFNGASDCFTDVVITLTPPNCSEEQVEIESVAVSCQIDDVTCSRYSIVAGGSLATAWVLECSGTTYGYQEILPGQTLQVCAKAEPIITNAVLSYLGNC